MQMFWKNGNLTGFGRVTLPECHPTLVPFARDPSLNPSCDLTSFSILCVDTTVTAEFGWVTALPGPCVCLWEAAGTTLQVLSREVGVCLQRLSPSTSSLRHQEASLSHYC